MKTILPFLLLIFAMLIVTVSAFAQTPAAAPTVPSDFPLDSLMNYLTPIIALIVTGFANKFIPKIPNALVPVIASIVGLATNYLTAMGTGHPANPWLGLLAGATATALHQVGTQINQANSNPNPSKGVN